MTSCTPLTKHRRVRRAVALLVVVLGAPAARAEPESRAPAAPTKATTPSVNPASPAGTESAAPSPEVVDARVLFEQGVKLAVEGKWSEALSSFERSGRLRPHPVTTYNVAFCERKLGHLTRALRAFVAALDESGTAGAPRLPPELLAVATRSRAELDSLLGTAIVTVDSADARILVDGRPLLSVAPSPSSDAVTLAGVLDPSAPEPVPATTFRVRLDPGTHVFRFFEAGSGAWEVVQSVEPAQTINVPGRPTAKAKAAAASPKTEPSGHGDRTLAYSVLGAGGVGLLVGSVFGALALSKRSNLESECGGDVCPPERASEVRELGTFADVTTIALSIGAAGIALGAVLLATSSHPDIPGPGRRAIGGPPSIAVAPNRLGVRVVF